MRVLWQLIHRRSVEIMEFEPQPRKLLSGNGAGEDEILMFRHSVSVLRVSAFAVAGRSCKAAMDR